MKIEKNFDLSKTWLVKLDSTSPHCGRKNYLVKIPYLLNIEKYFRTVPKWLFVEYKIFGNFNGILISPYKFSSAYISLNIRNLVCN